MLGCAQIGYLETTSEETVVAINQGGDMFFIDQPVFKDTTIQFGDLVKIRGNKIIKKVKE